MHNHKVNKNKHMKAWVRDAARRAREPDFGNPPLHYNVKLNELDPDLQGAFQQLSCDNETKEFLNSCTGGSFVESVASTMLGLVYSVTDANGILGRGQMFVLSRAQIRTLLGNETSENIAHSLLDIGAGDGNVTATLASLVDKVSSTEVSVPMCRSLNAKGFNCINTSELQHVELQERQPFDLISLLNVLDRADKPLTMLKDIKAMLHPTQGQFLLAVVLPFSAFVEDGRKKREPSEVIPMSGGLCREGASFEAAATKMYQNVLKPAGFRVKKFSRVPYLCRGDFKQSYYVLSDAIFVLELDS